MTAVDTTNPRSLLARQDWETIRKKLKFFAFKATGSRSMERAEDMAHDAIARLWTDAGVRWNPETEPNVYRYLTGLVRGEASNERRLKRTSSEVLTGEETLAARGDDGAGSPELLLSHRQTTHVVFNALRERTAHDAAGSTVAELFAAGVDGAAEQAAASALSIDEIRRARRRVFDHAAAIQRELGDDSEVTS